VRPSRRWRAAAGYCYLAPAAFLTLVFVYWPLVASTALSFYDWNLVSPTWSPVGWQNYVELVHNRAFWLALANTLRAAAALTVLTVLVPLLLAVIVLRVPRRWQDVYRVVLFSPTVISMAIACAVWLWMFHPLHGVLNTLLRFAGIAGPSWLSSSSSAIWAIIIVTVWKTFGFNFVLYIAGLLAIPGEMYEAARVDGASGGQLFRHITIPLLAPTTLFVFLTTFILSPQNLFVPTQILTQGGPNGQTTTMIIDTYQVAIASKKYGEGAARAVLICIFLSIFSLCYFRITHRLAAGDKR